MDRMTQPRRGEGPAIGRPRQTPDGAAVCFQSPDLSAGRDIQEQDGPPVLPVARVRPSGAKSMESMKAS